MFYGHRVLTTQNTEYHMSGNLCVGVRDTRTQEWQRNHRAHGQQCIGVVGRTDLGGLDVRFDSEPVEDMGLLFENDLITSPVKSMRSPSDQTVQLYAPVHLTPYRSGLVENSQS